MGIFLSLIFVAGAMGFQAQLGYEPGFLAKEDAFRGEGWLPDLFEEGPYNSLYLNNSLCGKFGVEIGDRFLVRTTGSLGYSSISDVAPGFSIPADTGYWIHGRTDWRILEASVGAELGILFNLQHGQGCLFGGMQVLWGKLKGDSWFYNDYIYDTRDVDVPGTLSGWQGHLGWQFPVKKVGPFDVYVNGLFKFGSLDEKSLEIPEDAVRSQPLAFSRWGYGLGVSLAYNTKQNLILSLTDTARTSRSLCCCLYGSSFTPLTFLHQGGVAFLGGHLGGWIASGMTGLIIVEDPFVVATAPLAWIMTFDGSYWLQKPLLNSWNYIGVTLGSTVSAYWHGGKTHPGGSFGATLLGAFVGDLVSLAVATTYCSLLGDPWSYESGPPRWNTIGPFVWGVMLPTSVLPAIGAVIGYNLSLKRAREALPEQDDMGYERSWDEIC